MINDRTCLVFRRSVEREDKENVRRERRLTRPRVSRDRMYSQDMRSDEELFDIPSPNHILLLHFNKKTQNMSLDCQIHNKKILL